MSTKFRNYLTVAVVLLISLLLSGCGGGGSNGSSDSGSSTPAPVAITYSVSGVLTQNGEPLSDVTITLTKPSAHSAAVAVAFSGSQAETTTNENGEYSFSGLTAGTYTVTPSSDDYSFTPISTSVAVDSNESVATSAFTARDTSTPSPTPTPTSKYKISGLVGSHVALNIVQGSISGVTITLTGTTGIASKGADGSDKLTSLGIPVTGTTLTDTDGHFEFTVEDGSYYLTASRTGYRFSAVDNYSRPTIVLINITGRDDSGTQFHGSPNPTPVATPAPVVTPLPSILLGAVLFPEASLGSGRNGLVGATVTLTCLDNNNAILTTTTIAGGNYSFSGLTSGRYTITVKATGYTFTPATSNIIMDVENWNTTGDSRTFTVN